MPDFSLAFPADIASPVAVFGRLVAAMVLGGVVAQIYRHSRAEPPSSFTVTLVLLAILIAMVTQVIGDNVARAFSLVGALSIVRFRTVVRDTQDTAYVIFAVAVGMAVGAHNFWVAIGGIAVVSLAAFAMRRVPVSDETLPFALQVRIGLGHDVHTLINPTLDTFVRSRHITQVATTRQGLATDVSYRTTLRRDDQAYALVTALNRIEGVQSAELQRISEGDA
jgi:uncharacterized membrane protein YhiD involved in acid resistance